MGFVVVVPGAHQQCPATNLNLLGTPLYLGREKGWPLGLFPEEFSRIVDRKTEKISVREKLAKYEQ